MAKQAMKIPARQEDTRMVRARTFMGGSAEKSREEPGVLGGNSQNPRMDYRMS
jgi:hypothetical protein